MRRTIIRVVDQWNVGPAEASKIKFFEEASKTACAKRGKELRFYTTATINPELEMLLLVILPTIRVLLVVRNLIGSEC